MPYIMSYKIFLVAKESNRHLRDKFQTRVQFLVLHIFLNMKPGISSEHHQLCSLNKNSQENVKTSIGWGYEHKEFSYIFWEYT